MNKYNLVFIVISFAIIRSYGEEPFRPTKGSVPFLVYYASRYRGFCVGTLVHQMVVITAAVCVTNPNSHTPDTRPINIVTGSSYRHPLRGKRIQITKILRPKMPADLKKRALLLQFSPALLLMKSKVPKMVAEIPVRALDIDWKGEEALTFQEECVMPGWHFFYNGDKMYPGFKFALQRYLHVQKLRIVNSKDWCDPLTVKLKKAFLNLGFEGGLDQSNIICVRDGAYGSPLVCRGRLIGIMMSPLGQWANCGGQSNIIHLFNSPLTWKFMNCIDSLLEADAQPDWNLMKKTMKDDVKAYDYSRVDNAKLLSEILADSASSDSCDET